MAIPLPLAEPRPLTRPSVSRLDLIPELGIAAGSVAVTALVHWAIVLRLNDNSPLLLFAATAAALTFWRGLGPGMLASSLGSAVGPYFYALPMHQAANHRNNLPFETMLLAGGSLFVCWLIYRLRVQQEDTQAVQSRQDTALAFVSHELRQPLSNIMLVAGILERDGSDEMRSRATTLIQRSATRLANVIDELADVTQLQGNAIKVDRADIRLQEPLLAAIDAARPGIDQKQQWLKIQLSSDRPMWVSGDATRLEQVFANLLSNASRYSPEGGEIAVSLTEKRGKAVVVVQDTGIGIRRDMLQRIFEPFVREMNARVDGLGIGLTLARNLVAQHGGAISAHSDGPGRGSTFTVELPLLSAAVKGAA